MLAAAGLYAAAPVPNVTQIIQRSVEANDRDWRAAPDYNHFEQDRTAGGTKTYQVLMILGSPYRKLVAVNGNTLSPAERSEEQHKLDQEIARRRSESPAQRAARIANYRRGRQRDHQLMSQLVQAFNFRPLGRQRLGQHSVYVLKATPRPGYIPPNLETRVLTGMQGKLWIDTKTFQWVKVEAEVMHPVWIEGFLARVDPGTRFELEYAPVSHNVWLPTRFVMKSRAKILFVISHSEQADESYFGYSQAPVAAASASRNRAAGDLQGSVLLKRRFRLPGNSTRAAESAVINPIQWRTEYAENRSWIV